MRGGAITIYEPASFEITKVTHKSVNSGTLNGKKIGNNCKGAVQIFVFTLGYLPEW